MALTRTPPHLGTLIVLTGLSVLTLNMFLPSLPAMTRSFGVDQGIMGVAVSGYMLVAALMVAGGAGLTALTLRALGQDAAPERLLALMMASVALSLVFALAALAMERRARRAAVPHG